MAKPDPALGIAVDFPEEDFRNGIRFAMQMGRPNDEALAPSFGFPSNGVIFTIDGVTQAPETVRVDRDGRPLNPRVRVTRAPARRVTVDCAVEVFPVDNNEELPVGNFRPSRAEVTVFDVDWQKIRGCRDMRYNGDTYIFAFEPAVNGLFGVDTHTLVFYALKDT